MGGSLSEGPLWWGPFLTATPSFEFRRKYPSLANYPCMGLMIKS